MKTQTKNVLFVLIASLFILSGVAEAAVPTALTGAIDTLETDSATIIDAVIPVVAAIFGSLMLIKLFKRAGNKI